MRKVFSAVFTILMLGAAAHGVNAAVMNNTPWVDDALPAGAISGAEGGDSWNWVGNNPVSFSGSLASQSSAGAGLHQHYFWGATSTLTVNAGDSLFAYV